MSDLVLSISKYAKLLAKSHPIQVIETLASELSVSRNIDFSLPCMPIKGRPSNLICATLKDVYLYTPRYNSYGDFFGFGHTEEDSLKHLAESIISDRMIGRFGTPLDRHLFAVWMPASKQYKTAGMAYER